MTIPSKGSAPPVLRPLTSKLLRTFGDRFKSLAWIEGRTRIGLVGHIDASMSRRLDALKDDYPEFGEIEFRSIDQE